MNININKNNKVFASLYKAQIIIKIYHNLILKLF